MKKVFIGITLIIGVFVILSMTNMVGVTDCTPDTKLCVKTIGSIR